MTEKTEREDGDIFKGNWDNAGKYCFESLNLVTVAVGTRVHFEIKTERHLDLGTPRRQQQRPLGLFHNVTPIFQSAQWYIVTPSHINFTPMRLR